MKHEITTEKILEIAKKCSEAKKLLEAQFPDVLKPDKSKNVVTQFPDESNKNLNINNVWAASIFFHEAQGDDKPAHHKLNGRCASIFLATCNGKWYDENGNPIHGYLYYEPNKKQKK